MKISKKVIIHYFLIYLLLVSVGSVKYAEFHNFFYFINKIFDSNMKFDLSNNTGNARIQCMIADLAMTLRKPLGWGYTAYETAWSSYLNYNIFSDFSSVGLTKSFAVYGIPMALYILIMYIKGFIRTSKSLTEWLCIICIYINTIIAQPSICFGCFTILIFTAGSKRGKKNDSIKAI